jgi:iron complex outermembrane recepter protein
VVNIILAEQVSIFDTELEGGMPTRGTFTRTEANAGLTRIAKGNRFSIYGQYDRTGAITEAERDVSSSPLPVDEAPFRTLQGRSANALMTLGWSRELPKRVNLSLGGEISRRTVNSLLGLRDGVVTVPASSPFARSNVSEDVALGFDELGAIRRRSVVTSFSANAGLTGALGKWQWSFTNDLSRTAANSRTDGDVSLAALQSAVKVGTANPFASNLSPYLTVADNDTSRNRSGTMASTGTISGNPFRMPAGMATVSLKLGYSHTDIDSDARNRGVLTSAKLSRDAGNGLASLSLPLTSRKENVLGVLGDISLQLNAGRTILSDFDHLNQYGAGVNWALSDRLSFSAQYIAEDKAPTLGNLGDPQIITANVPIYDFRTGQTVQISRLTGGNAVLRPEKQRDIKLTLNWRPAKPDGLTFNLEYFRNRSTDVTADFPLLTDEIEAAFASRIARDGNGRLVSIDARPINYARRESDSVRVGIGFRGSFGTPVKAERSELETLEQQMRRAGGTPPGNGQPVTGQPGGGQNGPRPPGARGPGGGPGGAPAGGGPFRGPPPADGTGRWDVDLNYTYQIRDLALIAAGTAPLDFLHGDGSGSSGGTRQHRVELRGGVMRGAFGLRLSGSYQSGSIVEGASGASSSRLDYADLLTLNMRFFLNFDQRKSWIAALPFLKGSRFTFKVDNIFDTAQKITDGTGAIPLRYQGPFQDPVGRYVEIAWRKKF